MARLLTNHEPIDSAQLVARGQRPLDFTVISLANLELFETKSAKAANDSVSKIRESMVEAFVRLLYLNPTRELEIPLEIRTSNRYTRVKDRLKATFDSLPHAVGRTGTVADCVHRGGRSTNYDFDIYLTDDPKTPVHLELKYGESIYDQPQILSLYVNSPTIQGTRKEHYAHYFYASGFLAKLCLMVGTSMPARDAYLAGVFGTIPIGSPFTDIRAARTDRQKKAWIDGVVHASIDEYLSILEDALPEHVDIDGVAKRLLAQTDKYFLSIDPSGAPYSIEQIGPDDLTVVGRPTCRTRKNGQKSSLVLPMRSGATAVMLLRWKNHSGVQGPAWQIRLEPPRLKEASST